MTTTLTVIVSVVLFRGCAAVVADAERFIRAGAERVARYEAHEAETARRRDRAKAGLMSPDRFGAVVRRG